MDNSNYLEELRTEHMKAGNCELCGEFTRKLERHHEQYRPERCTYLCHHCHHKVHFLPWQLTDEQKKKLLEARHGTKQFKALLRKPHLIRLMIKGYVAPGRRRAQLEVRKRVRGKK